MYSTSSFEGPKEWLLNFCAKVLISLFLLRWKALFKTNWTLRRLDSWNSWSQCKNSRVSDPDPDPYWIRIRIHIGSGFNQVSGSGSGSRSTRAKMTLKRRKKLWNFMFWSAGCSLLRAEGFLCNLDVLYEGLGISNWFLIKIFSFFFSCKSFSIFGHQNPGSGSGVRIGSGSVFSLKCWILIRIKWIRIRNTEK